MSDYHDNGNNWGRRDPADPHAMRCDDCGGAGGRHADDCDEPAEILRMRRPDIGITVISRCSGTRHSVEWTDYVANDWQREFYRLSDAVAFVGFLLRAEEEDFRICEGSGNFADKAQAFFDAVAGGPAAGPVGPIPAGILRPLTETLARWDGRGPADADADLAGRAMASAVMDLLIWDVGR